jgi:nucleoside-diphosphate-sugar epimerase
VRSRVGLNAEFDLRDGMTMNTTPPTGRRRALVMGASGFVGSHVTRKLVERGDDVRVYLRKSSSTVAIDDLDVERCYGDLNDEEALRAAMSDRDVVFYCVVDTRAWLRDPAPLFETNVESLRRVLDIATQVDLHRFVFCSTIGTVALGNGRAVTEDDPFNWHGKGGPYIESRREAEAMVLNYAKAGRLPAVAMCVSNPYGPRDWHPSQGLMVQMAAFGKIPVYIKGVATEVVGVEDVAEAFLLAGERGRIGERYIISESYMSMREMFETAANAVGAKPPRLGVPLALLKAVGYATSVVGRLLRRDVPLNATGVRLLYMTSPADHSKATRELGWRPRPAADSIRRAAQFYVEHRKEMSSK